MDQIVCPEKGRTVASGKPTISGGTIFVDHATGRIKFFPQARSDTQTTLRGKHALEREADDLGFRIRSFVSDNGIFTSKDFQLDLQQRQQPLHLSGVGAKHQNGVAENAIKTVSNLARAMLIHAALRWPASHDLTLWPFCLEHAVYIWNRLLSKTDGLSPEEKWTGTKSDHHELRRLHPWGCPSYVLEPTLQDVKKLPKWKPKSKQGKFLGISPSHASNVAPPCKTIQRFCKGIMGRPACCRIGIGAPSSLFTRCGIGSGTVSNLCPMGSFIQIDVIDKDQYFIQCEFIPLKYAAIKHFSGIVKITIKALHGTSNKEFLIVRDSTTCASLVHDMQSLLAEASKDSSGLIHCVFNALYMVDANDLEIGCLRSMR